MDVFTIDTDMDVFIIDTVIYIFKLVHSFDTDLNPGRVTELAY